MTTDEQTDRDELLEALDALSSADGDIDDRAAAMLIRAQAERIDELEDELYSIAVIDAGASL